MILLAIRKRSKVKLTLLIPVAAVNPKKKKTVKSKELKEANNNKKKTTIQTGKVNPD